MAEFEVVFAKIIEAEDFFDAVDKVKSVDATILNVSALPEEEEDVYEG